MLDILRMALALTYLICWIMTGLRTFADRGRNGTLHGMLGIVTCGLWALVWGWVNRERYDYGTILVVWTASLVLNVALTAWAVAQL